MTGLVQCLVPPASLSAISPNNPFHHLLYEFAILLSNTLPAIVLAAICYACWRPQEVGSKLLRPGGILAVTVFVTMALKYVVGFRHGRALPLDCCMGYVLSLDYSMPSVHATTVTLLVLFLSEPYALILSPQVTASVGAADEEELDDVENAAAEKTPGCTIPSLSSDGAADPVLFKDARIRLIALWFYAFAIYYVRIALRLNGVIDVMLGVFLGTAAFFSARLLLRWLAGEGDVGEKID